MADTLTVIAPANGDRKDSKSKLECPKLDEISDLVSLFGDANDRITRYTDIPKGLEYFFSNNSNRMIIQPAGCCACGRKKYIVKDRSSQRIYIVKSGGDCQSKLLATVEDLRKKEILRFERIDTYKLRVIYRGGQKLGEIIGCKHPEALSDSYLLYIVNGPEDEEVVRIFSEFDDTDNCWSNDEVNCTILQKGPPYEIGTIQHITRGLYGHCCGSRSSYTRTKDFRMDLVDHFDPYLKCLVLAAAFWRMAEGFRRYKDSAGQEGWHDRG